MNIDITKINVWWFDYQWLGAGRVRFGIYTPDGGRLVCHQFENAGANTVPFTRTGTLPLTTENVNTGATGSSSELRESCMAMYTEGTFEDWTFWRTSDIDSVAKTVTATTTNIVAFRAKVLVPELNHHNSINILPETLNIYCDQPFRLDLFQSVTTTGGTWDVTTASSLLEASTNTSISLLPLTFKTWFFGAGAHSVDLTDYFEPNDEGIIPTSAGGQETWAFAGKRLGGTDSIVTLNMGYKELW